MLGVIQLFMAGLILIVQYYFKLCCKNLCFSSRLIFSALNVCNFVSAAKGQR